MGRLKEGIYNKDLFYKVLTSKERRIMTKRWHQLKKQKRLENKIMAMNQEYKAVVGLQ